VEVIFGKIDELCSKELRAFSVRLGDCDQLEYHLFTSKIRDMQETHKEEVDLLLTALLTMKKNGADKRYFVTKGQEQYLPVVPSDIFNDNDYGVRLYGMYLRPSLILLFNGGIKTKQHPKDCNNIKKHFHDAMNIVAKVDKAIIEKDIDIDMVDPISELIFEIQKLIWTIKNIWNT